MLFNVNTGLLALLACSLALANDFTTTPKPITQTVSKPWSNSSSTIKTSAKPTPISSTSYKISSSSYKSTPTPTPSKPTTLATSTKKSEATTTKKGLPVPSCITDGELTICFTKPIITFDAAEATGVVEWS